MTHTHTRGSKKATNLVCHSSQLVWTSFTEPIRVRVPRTPLKPSPSAHTVIVTKHALITRWNATSRRTTVESHAASRWFRTCVDLGTLFCWLDLYPRPVSERDWLTTPRPTIRHAAALATPTRARTHLGSGAAMHPTNLPASLLCRGKCLFYNPGGGELQLSRVLPKSIKIKFLHRPLSRLNIDGQTRA